MSSRPSESDRGEYSPTALDASLISPRRGLGVCPRCFDLIAEPRGLCRNCNRNGDNITAFVPISYSIGGELLHRELAAYKRDVDPSVPFRAGRLAQLLGDFLGDHGHCLAEAAGVKRFDLVTTVASGSADPPRDNYHPLRELVREIPQLRDRWERVLYPGLHRGTRRAYDPLRYFAFPDLSSARILMIDDLWTTGSSAQSAAAALRAAGASVVAVVAIGRHLNRGWANNDLRLQRLRGNFHPHSCPLCATQTQQNQTGYRQPRVDRWPSSSRQASAS
jgi:hypothetical protein